jgi:hypothetical protein
MSVAKKNEDTPLIPESYFDVPTQRLYALSLGLLCQVSPTVSRRLSGF